MVLYNYCPSPVNSVIFRRSSANRRSSSETALSICWRTVELPLPFGRERKGENYHKGVQFYDPAEAMQSSFHYTKLLAKIWRQGMAKLTREVSCGVGQVSLKCGILQLLMKRSPLTCIYT